MAQSTGNNNAMGGQAGRRTVGDRGNRRGGAGFGPMPSGYGQANTGGPIDTGLDEQSDEYQYLHRKKQMEQRKQQQPGSAMSVAEAEATLKTTWASFKSANDKLKAEGYDYAEAKDGMYGKPISNPGAGGSFNDLINKVKGPKGTATSGGFNGQIFYGVSYELEQAQTFQKLQDKLIAKGVDLVKLEKDNPYGLTANGQVATFGAAPTGSQNENDILAMGGQAGRRTVGDRDNRRRGGADTGLDPKSDEYKYLQALQESQHVGFSSPKIEDTTAGLAGAWSQFKSDNEKLKAEGYDYQEVKPGFYGKPVASTDNFLTRVSGPNGDIVSVTGSLSSELKDIRVRAKGPATLYDASQQFSADQKVDELSKALIAKGVDLVKLEKDNPYAPGANGSVTFGAAPTGTQNENDFLAMGGQAGRRIVGDRDNRRRGGTSFGPMPSGYGQANTGGPIDTGLDPQSDEYQYLKRKKEMEQRKRLQPGSPMSVAEAEAALQTTWADFKSANDKLKAEGYDYQEAKDGMYGKPIINPGVGGSFNDLINKVKGPKGTATNGGFNGQFFYGVSSDLEQAQLFQEVQDRLIAKGVDLVKLEQDNPYAPGGNGQLMTFGAAPGATYIPQIDPIQAQTDAMNAGTWKPSDGYYFSSPNGVGFDPTGMLADNRITNPEKYRLATSDADGIPDKDGYVRIPGTQVGDNTWLKENGYDYQDVSTVGMPMVQGSKGAFNQGWSTDPAKKGDYQKMEEASWEKAGVTFNVGSNTFGNESYGSAVENMNWSQQATNIISDPINHPRNRPGLVDTSWLKPNGLTLEQAQAKAAALVNPVDGTPKPGVTQEMIAQAAKDVIISSGRLKVVNGMIVDTTNLITSDPMQSNMLPSPEWLGKMGYAVGTGGVDDVLGADGKMYSIQFPSEIAKAKNQPAATAEQTAAAMAAANYTPAPIDRSKENELKAIWQSAINSASDIDQSTGAAEIAKRNQAMLTAESNYKNELARNDRLFQSSMVTAQNAIVPAGGAFASPSTNQALAVPAPATQPTNPQPTNPDYSPALVHPELNPTGSIQKQMELNAFFHSPDPDIQETLKSDLNPTGSLKKQAELNHFFASVAPSPATAQPTGFDPSTVSIVTNANSGAVLPQNQTIKPALVPDKNGILVPASTTKGGAIGAPGSGASAYSVGSSGTNSTMPAWPPVKTRFTQ